MSPDEVVAFKVIRNVIPCVSPELGNCVLIGGVDRKVPRMYAGISKSSARRVDRLRKAAFAVLKEIQL